MEERMKKKIKSYINYEFRDVPDTKEVQEAKDEAFANLCDLYDDLISKGKTEEEAYIGAIKNLGEFSKNFKSEIKEEYVSDPKWADALLVISVVTAIFSLPLLVFHFLFGTILLVASALSFAVSAYFMNQKAVYVLNEKKDLELHNHLLTKVFRFARRNRIFWILSVSYVVTIILSTAVFKLVSFISFLGFNGDLSKVPDLVEAQLYEIPVFSLMLSVFILPLCIIISTRIYRKACVKYFRLTGNVTVNGKTINTDLSNFNPFSLTAHILSFVAIVSIIFPFLGYWTNVSDEYYIGIIVLLGSSTNLAPDPLGLLVILLMLASVVLITISYLKVNRITPVLSIISSVLLVIVLWFISANFSNRITDHNQFLGTRYYLGYVMELIIPIANSVLMAFHMYYINNKQKESLSGLKNRGTSKDA
jgi:hypothetical protein